MDNWRFSDSKILRFISFGFCSLGEHEWVWLNGRPLNCGVCGLRGHPLEEGKIDKIIRMGL